MSAKVRAEEAEGIMYPTAHFLPRHVSVLSIFRTHSSSHGLCMCMFRRGEDRNELFNLFNHGQAELEFRSSKDGKRYLYIMPAPFYSMSHFESILRT